MSVVTIGGHRYNCKEKRVRSGKGKKRTTRAYCERVEKDAPRRRRRRQKSSRGRKSRR